MEIPGFKIEAQIGQGGMATVYLATQESLDRKVALKVLSASLSSADRSYCERFLKEGKIIAQLSHPNIVTIYDIGCHETRYYMSMEYAGAPNLKQRIQARQLSEKQALAVVEQIARALSYAHTRGFVHRDVKPANILFRTDGTAVLSDFGIAKALNSHTQFTAIGWAVGTPEYMSPEQALGKDVDLRSDLYSLGIVLYEILAGEKPFVGKDLLSTALMHARSPIPRLPEPVRQYQPIIDRLLAKTPEERFSNAAELLQALAEEAARPARAPPRMGSATMTLAPAIPSVHPSGGRRWRWIGAFSFLALLGAGFLFTSSFTPFFAPQGGTDTTPAQSSSLLAPQAQGTRLSPEEQAKVVRLLEIAQIHLAVGRLTDPPGSNAYEAYHMVLEIDPDNDEAKSGLQQIEIQLGQAANSPNP